MLEKTFQLICMNISAINDCMYTLEEAEIVESTFSNLGNRVAEIYKIMGAEKNFNNILHRNGHSFLQEQRMMAYDFIDKKLKE